MEPIRGDVITTEMRARVTLRETNRGAIYFEVTRPEPMVQALVRLGYIDPHHEEYGLYFMGLRNAWLAPAGYKGNSIYREIMEFFSVPGYAADLYSLIRHEIGLPRAETTVKVIESAFTEPAKDIPAAVGEVYFKEFELLVKAVDRLRKKNVES